MGTVRRNVETSHLARFPHERRIIEPFVRGFTVTAGTRVSRGGDEVSAFYLKPDPDMAQLLGLERELLLIYAPFPDLQARTIELHDFIVSTNRARLDPLGTVIVSNAANTKALIQSVLLQEPDRPPIVALRTEELQRIDSLDALKAVFLAQFFQRDLFGVESPVTNDSLFFGRQQLTTELFDRARNGQNSGLFGLRRMGKTSVLNAVGRRLEAAQEGAFTYIYLQDPSRYKLRGRELLEVIVKQVAQKVPAERLEISKVFALRRTYSEAMAAQRFREDMRALLPIVPGGRIVLGLDELESISFELSPAPHWNDDFLPFWQAIRGLHQEAGGRFTFIVSGINPQPLERHQVGRFDNPLFETSRLYYLQPFAPPDVEAMIGTIARLMGLEVEPAVIAELVLDFGGHPYLTRKACSVAVSGLTRPGKLTLEHFESRRDVITLEINRIAMQILAVLGTWYPEEYELVRRLARGDGAGFKAATRSSDSLTQHLEGYGLVRTSRTAPEITIGAVRRHLERIAGPANAVPAVASDPDAVLLEISRHRNPIEKALRKAVSDGLKFRYGPDRAGHQALQCWPEQRRAVLQQYAYEERWEHTYFDELTAVVEKEWPAFQAFFSRERAEVSLWLDHINRSRSDAHARSLKEEDLVFLRVCFVRMEELLGLV